MKIHAFIFAALIGLLSVDAAHAQLPTNPWESPKLPTRELPVMHQRAYIKNNQLIGSQALPGNPWAVKTSVVQKGSDWRNIMSPSRQNYTGENTQWRDKLNSQEAPEVNRNNMLIMIKQLRELGYKIPNSYDSKVISAPADYASKLRSSYSDVQRARDPLSQMSTGMMDVFEGYTGLDINNLMFNSLDLISKD